MLTRKFHYLILSLLFISFGEITLSQNGEVYISEMYKYRILSAKGIVLEAPMVKDKETKKKVSKSLQDGWGYSGSEAKNLLNGLEKEGQPVWIQDGISEEEEKVIQTLNGYSVRALTNEYQVLLFFPSVNGHLPAKYRFKESFSLVVGHYYVVLDSYYSKILETADTSKPIIKLQAYINYPVQVNKLNPYKESASSYVTRPPDWQLKAARMKRLFQVDSTGILRTENANLWPKGLTNLSAENLAKLKAYYLFSYWVNKTEYLYIRIPGKENASIFPEIGFLANHDLYYTVENNSNYITWTGAKPAKDFRVKNIIQVMQKAMIAFENHDDYRDLYKPGGKWDTNEKGAGLMPTELYVLNSKASGQVIHRNDKFRTYQFMTPLEKSANRIDAAFTAYELAMQVAEEAKLIIKPGSEAIEFKLTERRNLNDGVLYALEYKNDNLVGKNKFQLFVIMSTNDVVWLNHVFRNEIYGYLF